MATKTFDIADVVRLTVQFADQSGAPVDPGQVLVRIKSPSGSVTVYTYATDIEVIKESTGRYHTDLDVDAEGTWFYRWEGRNSNKGASEGSFIIRGSEFF
jgi:hypothetical protein